jgi:hypothetical protein
MIRRLEAALCVALALANTHARAEPEPAPPPAAEPESAEPERPALPAQHVPRLTIELAPKSVMVGDLVKLTLHADALEGDDVAVPEQSFAPFEVHAKRSRIRPAKDGRVRHEFELDLLAFDPGRHELGPVELRVVTKDGLVGSVLTNDKLAVEVDSLLGNEPNAQLKPETDPVVVMQDDYTLLYIAGGLAAAALIALITWLVARYLQRRVKPVPPPPPPRPPWEIAAAKLAELRRRKSRMIEEGQSAQFVDEVSDVVREYLGGRFGFDGLETTTDEMLGLLRERHCNSGLLQEVGTYLRRCDLVKFAKVEPDRDEADLVFAKAQDIVQFSMPLGDGYGALGTETAPEASATPHKAPEAASPRGPEGGEP